MPSCTSASYVRQPVKQLSQTQCGYPQGDDVITRGEPYRELIIITSGKARSVPASTGDEVSPRSPSMDLAVKDMGAVIEYTAGSFFGELVRHLTEQSILSSQR
eukprot:COSAG02_NODE_6916_length_3291_cov_1.183271_3_plen_103_part_00